MVQTGIKSCFRSFSSFSISLSSPFPISDASAVFRSIAWSVRRLPSVVRSVGRTVAVARKRGVFISFCPNTVLPDRRPPSWPPLPLRSGWYWHHHRYHTPANTSVTSIPLPFLHCHCLHHQCIRMFQLRTNGQPDRRTDGRTDGRTDRRTNGRTDGRLVVL